VPESEQGPAQQVGEVEGEGGDMGSNGGVSGGDEAVYI